MNFFYQFKELESIPNGVANGEIARIKGVPVSSGKVKARCCVAMTLEEAQNIKVGILKNSRENILNFFIFLFIEWRYFDNL
jgi:hypothetical protein